VNSTLLNVHNLQFYRIPPKVVMIDLQVNGYAGVDFNSDDLTLEQVEHACEILRQDGVKGILATIITADHDAMCQRLANIVKIREQSALATQMIIGLHIEGPFLSPVPGYIGAHPAEHACPANLDLTKKFLEAGNGLTRLFTLAPEQDINGEITSWLNDQKILVAAGHCNPSLDQLKASIDAGLKLFTHLGNGCPMQMHRHDNIIQRALSFSDKLIICFIADGAHVPLFVLKNYLRCVGIEHSIVVSDTISAAGLGPGTYHLADQTVVIEDDLVPWAEDRSHFVGSACPLKNMVVNLKSIGLTALEIDCLVRHNPRKILGL